MLQRTRLIPTSVSVVVCSALLSGQPLLGFGQELATLKGHSDMVRSVAFSPTGKSLASGGDDGTIRLWNIEARKTTQTLKQVFLERPDTVWMIAFSPDGKILASTGAGGVRLWDVKTGEKLRHLKPGPYGAEVRAMAFSPDGKMLASGAMIGPVSLWDTQTGKQKWEVNGQSDLCCLAFSPDGKTFATGHIATPDCESIILWDVASGKPRTPLRGRRWEMVEGLAYSPDGKTLASARTDGTVTLWDMETHQVQAQFEAHWYNTEWGWPEQPSALCVQFTRDGKVLVTGYDDGSIKLRDVSTGQELATLKGHTADVSSVALSPDGEMLASGGLDCTVRLWDYKAALRQAKGKQAAD